MASTYILLFMLTFISVSFLLPEHKIEKRQIMGTKTLVIDGKKVSRSCTKVFVTIVVGNIVYRKRKIVGKRENGSYLMKFACKGCEKQGIVFILRIHV